MAVNEKTNIVINGYLRGTPPVFQEGYTKYLQDELQRIEASLRSLVSAGVEVLDKPPQNPTKGMLKYNVSPWDALGDSSEGLVVYNGTSWVNV